MKYGITSRTPGNICVIRMNVSMRRAPAKLLNRDRPYPARAASTTENTAVLIDTMALFMNWRGKEEIAGILPCSSRASVPSRDVLEGDAIHVLHRLD